MLRRFRQWLMGLRRPVRWAVILILAFGVTLTTVTLSATAWEYTNSPEFCGTVCHTMPPEYTAYQVSPHARVDCVDCHLGQDSILLTAPRKAKEINHVINALTQAYEPPIYVKNLRPARETCEQCHNPEKFSSDTFVEIQRYAEDEANTETRNFLIVKTGGGTSREGLGRGIHWHVENEVWFYSDDPLKQDVPYIREITPAGETIEYFDVEANLPADFGQQVEAQLHRMDCIDCHTRISHLFRSPGDALDQAIARRLIERDIPEIKKQGVELLSQEYASTEAGLAAISERLPAFYQENYSDYYAANQPTVDQAVEEIKTIFTQTVFPNMQVGWETHPNNIGHKEFPGCFRCHDGKHTSATGQTIRLECNICHSIPEIVVEGQSGPVISLEQGNEPDSHRDSNWLARHRFEFDQSCAECHDIGNPGGTDNSGFCANSGCHATEWQFAGLDAPAIRAMVQPPPVPGSTEPRAVPHPIGSRTDCAICHAAASVIPAPDDHTSYEQRICTQCHEATLAEGAFAAATILIPVIPHLVENQSDRCLECHGSDQILPYPADHATFAPKACLFCHDVQVTRGPVQLDESGIPYISHPLAGRADCVLCHGLDSIVPYPFTHEGREVDKCQNCHLQVP